jgi:hypothetical protein
MKILTDYTEPKPELKPVLMFSLLEGAFKYKRITGPAWPTKEKAEAYRDSRDLRKYGVTQEIVRVWRYVRVNPAGVANV